MLLVLAVTGCFAKPPRPEGEPADGPADGDATDRPRLAAAQPASRTAGSSLSYSITIPDEPDRYLLVTIQIGTNCDDSAPPITNAELHAGIDIVPLVSVAQLISTPCGGNTHSELYELRAPAPGSHEVVVAVAGTAPSLHSAALAFVNVDGAQPIRAQTMATGDSAMSSVAIASEPGDLVVNTVGFGAAIDGPGASQHEIFRRNVATTTTLHNSAASFASGTGAQLDMTWDAASVEQWQTISTALRAPGT